MGATKQATIDATPASQAMGFRLVPRTGAQPAPGDIVVHPRQHMYAVSPIYAIQDTTADGAVESVRVTHASTTHHETLSEAAAHLHLGIWSGAIEATRVWMLASSGWIEVVIVRLEDADVITL